MDLETLALATSPEITVGIGLADGDPREDELLARATFCPVRVYREHAPLLADLMRGIIGAGARGSLPSAPFLLELKRTRGCRNVRRVALLSLHDGTPFLLGPVGIDEGGTYREMSALAGDCRRMCALLGWEPKVAVLSAGRPEDAERGHRMMTSIRRGERLAEADDVRHYNISIEEALPWANCVIAPDGVSGNLVYRTLTRLGTGSSLGALYFPLRLRLADTSRTGAVEEYLGAIALANLAAVKSGLDN